MPVGMGEKNNLAHNWHTNAQTEEGRPQSHRSKCLPYLHLPQCPARDSNPEPTD